jgi:hypothetical protein
VYATVFSSPFLLNQYQEAAQWLADAIAEMDTDCLFEDLAWRRGARQRLWEAFSHAEACANAAHVKRKEVEVARAESADAETVLEEQLKTEEGSARHKYLMQLQFGEDLFKVCVFLALAVINDVQRQRTTKRVEN